MQLSFRLLALAPGVRGRLAALVAASLAITATYVGQGVLVARVLAAIFAGDGFAATIPSLAGIVILMVARALLLAWREVQALHTSGLVKEAVRTQLVAKLFELGPGWLQRTRGGTVQSTLVDGVETLDPYVGRYLPQAVAAVIGASAVTTYVIILDPLVGLIILGCALLVPVLPSLSRRLLDRRSAPWWLTYKAIYADNLDALQGMATLKAFNASRRHGQLLSHQARNFCRDSVRLLALVIVYVGAVSLLVGVGTAAAVGIGAVQRAYGVLTTAELLVILLLSRECFRPLQDLQDAYHAAYMARPACKGIFELLDAAPEVTGLNAPAPAAGLPALIPRPPALVFEQVCFAYRERSQKALDHFTLRIEPGERVALVGRSGAGKTTVASLLLRFFELQSGRITMGEVDIKDLPLHELRSLVAVVAQDTYLFHGSLSRNLTLGRAEVSQADIEAAARSARAHEFIRALPHGYDTVVGERGLTLSGGERQRIAIARALLKDSPVLVLDEATSSVDANNEAGIQETLDALTRGRTTLVIAHRLSTVRNADRIVVLDAGRVIEVGRHDALLADRGAYARLVLAQEGAS